MKKYILFSIIGLATLSLGVGCVSVEKDPADTTATHSTTTTSREMSVAPLSGSSTTTTRSTAVQAY